MLVSPQYTYGYKYLGVLQLNFYNFIDRKHDIYLRQTLRRIQLLAMLWPPEIVRDWYTYTYRVLGAVITLLVLVNDTTRFSIQRLATIGGESLKILYYDAKIQQQSESYND